MITIELDAQAIEKASQQISLFPKLYPRAAKLAYTRALQAMRIEMSRKTSELYYVRSSEVKQDTRIKSTGLLVFGFRRRLMDYKLTPTQIPKGRQHGLYGAVKRAGGLKRIPSGFLMYSHLTGYNLEAYVRYAPGRGNHWRGIFPLIGPSFAQIVKNPEVIDATLKRGQEVFNERMKHEMLREMGAVKS